MKRWRVRVAARDISAYALRGAVMLAYLGAVYVVIVVGLGAALGTGGEPRTSLAIVATAIVALTFPTIREGTRRLANRVVYGARVSPEEALEDFSEHVGGAATPGELLPALAAALAEGTRAERCEVWLNVGGKLRPAAYWPSSQASDDGAVGRPSSGVNTAPVIGPEGDLVVTVRQRDDVLGALALRQQPRSPFTAADRALVEDLASQAGVVLRNVQLSAELADRLHELELQAAELQASRQRIVREQASERHRIERNIHDGAQQYLVALRVRLRLAVAAVERSPETAGPALDEAAQLVNDACRTLAELAQGLHPAALAKDGIVAALEMQAAALSCEVDLRARSVVRYAPEIEATVYFACLEAMQNAAKYAACGSLVIDVAGDGEQLSFSVSDDGSGFDPSTESWGSGLTGIAERIESLGGTFGVRSEPGAGTAVEGRVPLLPAG